MAALGFRERHLDPAPLGSRERSAHPKRGPNLLGRQTVQSVKLRVEAVAQVPGPTSTLSWANSGLRKTTPEAVAASPAQAL